MRIAVIGSSGAGKTTFGRKAAARLGVPFTELDAIYHQPGWTALSDDEFRARVAPLAAGDGWVIDGSYRAVRPIVIARADVVVWLDYSRTRVMSRVIRRSVVRGLSRAELWNGNRESLGRVARSDHPIRWTWTHFTGRRREFEELFAAPGAPRVDRLRRPQDAERWLDRVEQRSQPGVGR